MSRDAFQRQEWTAQQIAWVFVALFLVAAVAGFFGRGALSETTAEAEDGSRWRPT